jgi:hypothetical protein
VINGHRVVTFTPYGREVTVSILLEYMKRDHARGIVDEWQLWMNTDPDQVSDRKYAQKLADEYNWIVLKSRPKTRDRHQHKQMYTGSFYVYCTDPDTVYLRFDDDIVYVHDETIRRMVEQKILRPHVLGLFPIIWNNAICTWHLQQRSIIPQFKIGGRLRVVQLPYCMDPVGWADPQFAEEIHYQLLDAIEAGKVENLFMYQDVTLAPQQQFSVSCFAVHTDDYRILEPPGVLDYYEEENWLTVHRPSKVGKTNVILSDALVSHFSFFPQRDYLINQTRILDRYRTLAEALSDPT